MTNNLKTSLAVFISLVATCLYSKAQVPSDQNARGDFYRESGIYSMIYSGKYPDMYPNHIFEESPYLYDDFVSGSLSYRGKLYENVSLKLNLHKEQLYILNADVSDRRRLIELNPKFIDFFIIHGEKFIYFEEPENRSVAPSGYYTLLHDGNIKVMRHTKKQYIERIDLLSKAVVRSFSSTHLYILVQDGRSNKLTGKRSMLKLMSKHQKEVRHFIRNEHLSFSNPGGDYARCAAFYETLIK